jgi:hypothetical protein
MTPREFSLLLRCARPYPDVESIKDLVSKGIDWHILLELATQHGVRPRLFKSLKSACWDTVPQKIQLELILFNKTNVQKNLLFTGELLRLLDLFQQDSIPIAAFKGPVLAQSLYGNLSMREFSDLDVIIQEEDLSKAEKILIGRGYQPDFPDKEYRAAFLSYQGQYAFRHRDTGISVDLHWQLSSKGMVFPLQSAEIWPRLEIVTVASRTVLTLARDDLALFLAAHGTKEGWKSLMWVCDFAELLHSSPVDWVTILDRAQRSKSSRPLLLAIALASTLLGAPAPAALIDRVWKTLRVRKLVEDAKLRMLRTVPEGELEFFLNGLKARDRLRHKLLAIASLLTTRTVGDYEAMPLPKSLWGLYYLTRPFRLAGKMLKVIPGSFENLVTTGR